jgi:hypothetical protein
MHGACNILISYQSNETRAGDSMGAGFINVIANKIEADCL